MEALEHEAESLVAQTCESLVFQAFGCAAAEFDGAGGRFVEQTDNVEQGRFAAARRTHDADKLAGVDVEVDTVERLSLDGFRTVDF